MKRLATVTIIALGAVSCVTPVVTTSSTPGTPASVIDVQDGDSLVVAMNGIEERVRLIGVNAPEHDECFGPESASGLRELVDNKEV